jgi:hypothetical protein
VEQIEHGILPVGQVAGREVDVGLAAVASRRTAVTGIRKRLIGVGGSGSEAEVKVVGLFRGSPSTVWLMLAAFLRRSIAMAAFLT